MKLPYRTELDALGATYARALAADVGDVRRALQVVGGGPALFIGSGGSMAVAELAAYLHENQCRQPGRACTSLQALDAPQLARRGAVLFSSSAKHPDAQRVLEDFRRRRFDPAVLATHREAQDIGELAGFDTLVLTLPSLGQADGFLATGSILQLAALLLRAYLPDAVLPPTLSDAGAEEAQLRDEVLILTPTSLRSVAVDLEVRLVESGLAAVQVSDYRNFAHGRHTGFARRSKRVTVIALSASDSEPLATGTTAALPEYCDVRRWHVDGRWEQAVIELLHRSMRLVGAAGNRAGLDVARPKVPAFGRRLYRLPLRRRVPDRPVGGIERKLLAAGCGLDDNARRAYEAAAARWCDEIAQQRFAGVVLDYDGTVCWTRKRFELPEARMQDQLRAVLDAGALLGFASGRGRSLHTDLRRWMPTKLWDRVVLGLYNGGVMLSLADELPEMREPTPWSRAVTDALGAVPNAERLTVVERGTQVSLGVGGATHQNEFAAVVEEVLVRARVQASIATSGHSIDIMPAATTKVTVVERVEQRSGGVALSVGDQGQVGGNDYALLADRLGTLSVDRCSADPGSCWFAGRGDHVGPALLERHLRALRPRRGGLALTGLEIV